MKDVCTGEHAGPLLLSEFGPGMYCRACGWDPEVHPARKAPGPPHALRLEPCKWCSGKGEWPHGYCNGCRSRGPSNGVETTGDPQFDDVAVAMIELVKARALYLSAEQEMGRATQRANDAAIAAGLLPLWESADETIWTPLAWIAHYLNASPVVLKNAYWADWARRTDSDEETGR